MAKTEKLAKDGVGLDADCVGTLLGLALKNGHKMPFLQVSILYLSACSC